MDLIKEINQYLHEIYQSSDVSKIEEVKEKLNKFHENIQQKNELHPQVKKLLEIPQYEQRSPEWFDQRKNKLTSSDLDAVLGNNKYSSFDDVLFKKCGLAKPFTGNKFTLHGQKYEDEAIELYCKKYNKKSLSFGLLPHPTINFLAGSPDDITHDGIVIEVKCPMTRPIIMGEIPHHYISQIKMNMEICNLDKAVFIEYRPSCLTGGDYVLNVVELTRDPNWLPSVLPSLKYFWDTVQHYRNVGIQNHPKYDRYYKLANPQLFYKKYKCTVNPFELDLSSDSESDQEEKEEQKEEQKDKEDIIQKEVKDTMDFILNNIEIISS